MWRSSQVLVQPQPSETDLSSLAFVPTAFSRRNLYYDLLFFTFFVTAGASLIPDDFPAVCARCRSRKRNKRYPSTETSKGHAQSKCTVIHVSGFAGLEVDIDSPV